MIKFITNEPALFLTKQRTLVISDLHIGIEYDLYKSGINIPTQIEKMKDKVDTLIKKTKSKKIIFIGDIKHQVPGVSFQELREIPAFFKHFSDKIETHIVLGNHDSEIGALVERVNIHDTAGFKLEDFYLMHGHAWPKKEFLECAYIILSHTHPVIEIRDKLGYRFSQRVWAKAKFDLKKFQEKYKAQRSPKTQIPEIILMPAFNELAGGATLNVEKGRRQRPTDETFLGPLTSLIDKKQTEIFLLDGTCLGKLESLK